MNNAIIEIKNLRKDYHVGEVTVHALRGVDLKIQEGEFVAIMGASGSGKSVLLKLILGLLQPDAGRIFVNGERIDGMPERDLARVRVRPREQDIDLQQRIGVVVMALHQVRDAKRAWRRTGS